MLKSEIRQNFLDPPAVYRCKPFWAWNNELEESELRRQIHVLAKIYENPFITHR